MSTLELKDGTKLPKIDFRKLGVLVAAKLAPLTDEAAMAPHYPKDKLAEEALRELNSMRSAKVDKEHIKDWKLFVKRTNKNVKQVDGIWAYRHKQSGWVAVRLSRDTPVGAQESVVENLCGVSNSIRKGLIAKADNTRLITGHGELSAEAYLDAPSK